MSQGQHLLQRQCQQMVFWLHQCHELQKSSCSEFTRWHWSCILTYVWLPVLFLFWGMCKRAKSMTWNRVTVPNFVLTLQDDNAANSRIVGYGTNYCIAKQMQNAFAAYFPNCKRLFWWLRVFSTDCATQQAPLQTYNAGQNVSRECVTVPGRNVVAQSLTRCCAQDLLTTLHVHLMDETNSRAEISDCTNVCHAHRAPRHDQHSPFMRAVMELFAAS